MACTCAWSTPIRQDDDGLAALEQHMAGRLADDEPDASREPSHIHIPRPSRVAATNT